MFNHFNKYLIDFDKVSLIHDNDKNFSSGDAEIKIWMYGVSIWINTTGVFDPQQAEKFDITVKVNEESLDDMRSFIGSERNRRAKEIITDVGVAG